MATPRKDPKEHLPAGRPSKYDPSMGEIVIECRNKGFIVEEVCQELGIARDTFFNWVKEHPDFSDAYKKGNAGFNAFWARAYKKVMLGMPLNPKKSKKKPEKGKGKSKKNPKEEEAVELGKANPAMMIFYMKAHCGWRETIVNRGNFKIKTISPETLVNLNKVFNEEPEQEANGQNTKTKRS